MLDLIFLNSKSPLILCVHFEMAEATRNLQCSQLKVIPEDKVIAADAHFFNSSSCCSKTVCLLHCTLTFHNTLNKISFYLQDP